MPFRTRISIPQLYSESRMHTPRTPFLVPSLRIQSNTPNTRSATASYMWIMVAYAFPPADPLANRCCISTMTTRITSAETKLANPLLDCTFGLAWAHTPTHTSNLAPPCIANSMIETILQGPHVLGPQEMARHIPVSRNLLLYNNRLHLPSYFWRRHHRRSQKTENCGKPNLSPGRLGLGREAETKTQNLR
jgi:hypothetical protein